MAPPPADLKIEDIVLNDGYDIDKIMEHFKQEGRLDKSAVSDILKRCAKIISNEPNLLDIDSPCVIFGDLHGQFYDLANILLDYPQPSDTHMLFLGDYVDRGYFGCENILLLFSMKVTYPDRIHLLRGNHECRLLTTFFNFRQECCFKYGDQIYNEVMKTFDCLPICALLHSELGKFFCVHGGISPNLNSLQDINKFNRFREPPAAGLFCDLLWSDPVDESVYARLNEKQKEEWQRISFTENKIRGCSYCYGFAGVDEFLKKNELTSIIRAHEVQKEGCNLHYFNRDDITHPLVMTLFTAPNYCDVYDNDGAVLVLLDNELSFLSYNSVPHPFWLPKFQNGVSFSLPVLGETINALAKKLYAFSMYHDFVDDSDDKPIKFRLVDEPKEVKPETTEPKKEIKMPVMPTKDKSKRGISVEDFLQPLDLNEASHETDSFRTAASRSRSFVDRLPHGVPERKKPENRPRCCTFSMKGRFNKSFDRFSFSVTASPRFAEAKNNDVANEKRPVELEELKKQWGLVQE
ncbi:serine/threonine protein phosphatase 2B catalytic subunit gamma isoform, putative [Entamoeba invadens IP1]|uniref:serine/threonine protein phosphatase 2B catalytic subunit gamma isoform, putative n=1 Tax=Entamoeba invadens IP1 TaxID=370355 RepID=UPI0002C3E9B5|nr:serine/threonine protein phosphatase 2B catalytic subunit gamma isoform, putative [Entamoeba invadens IP1]ELP84995.1 serine/threonine protein phosphatase 2B catalytic subunit gamma isoform, putative [Entamoeba invadens IP1]|eukprot:XP_004184341.1 serine/threonine protein phosphatase 2B catalytic subunit gamma isoform, putative [Entamoeba invadens IP1]